MSNYNGVPMRTFPLPQSKYKIKATYPMVAKGVTVHNTYNNATAVNEINYMQDNNSMVSYHAAVDEKEIIFGVPLNRSTWHAGDGRNGYGNRNHISFEICYSKSGGVKYTKAEENAVKVIAYALHSNNWGMSKLKKHEDWSGKNCPHRILNERRWESFKKRVSNELSRLNGTGSQVSKPKPSTPNTSSNTYKVTSTLDGHLTANDAKSKKNKKTSVKPGIYYIYRTVDGMHNISTVKGKPGSWVNPSSSSASKPNPQPSKPASNIAVDGYWGKGTSAALQNYLGTHADGVISGQYSTVSTRNLTSITFNTKTGSNAVRGLQKILGVKQDGFLGPDTIRAMQRRFGTTVDGVISRPSAVVRELQRRLNKGKL